MKKYLSKKGIKIGAIVLAVALIVALGARAMNGRAGIVQNAAGAIKKPVQSVVGAVADWLEGIYGYMYKYDSLKAENEALQTQLAQAQAEARENKEAAAENERLKNLLEFKDIHTDYKLASARIMGRSASNWSSTFTISIGSGDDVKVGAPVINDAGAMVGQITELGSGWATVKTVVDASVSIGAVASESGSTGMLIGDYALMQQGMAKLSYLPNDSQIFEGDTVVTSGTGGTLPSGLVVGTISSVKTEAGGQVEYGLVSPPCELGKLTQVFVITNFDVVN